MIETIGGILGLITSIAGTIVAVYKAGFKNYNKRINKYYNKVLVPFFVKYKKDEKLNIIDFLTNKTKLDDDNIPKYIFYLIEQNKEEELKKVLIYDYLDFYPNDSNTMDKFIKIIEKIMMYIMFFLSFILMLLGLACIGTGVSAIIPTIIKMVAERNIQIIEMKDQFLSFIIGMTFFVTSIFAVIFVEKCNEDMYSVNKAKIEKMIAKKVSRYDAKNDKFVI